MSSNIHVYTHNDLDGLGCLLTIIWAFPDSTVSYTCISNANTFKEQYTKAQNNKSFDKIFITDLSLKQEDIHLIDKNNVIFIDHHKTSLNLQFTNAKKFVQIFSSCSLLVYKLLKSQCILDYNQKQLLVYIDDYDSYNLKFNISKQLNVLFWAHYQNSASLFIEDFFKGFKALTPLQSQAINIYNKKFNDIINNLKVFKCTAVIQNISSSITAAFAETSINDVSDYLFQKHNSDIIIIVNLRNNRVSFRRKKNIPIDVSLLAQNLCNGGGHDQAAGGEITEKFLLFSKIFEPV
jgi:oligoribonuclease NrnB/cAMP/cGMP phosphodiesterase (DHH superfamily)